MAMNDPMTLRDALRELTYSEARILVVDDDPAMVMFLQGLLERAGYARVLATTDPREAASLFDTISPDLVLLDLQMPQLDGFGVLQELRPRIPPANYLPILMLTGSDAPDAKRRALFGGAKDFLTKPFDPLELLLRLHNLLEARFIHLKLREQNDGLAQQVVHRAGQLLDAQNDTIERLAQVVEFHDDATGHHTRRVGEIAWDIAKQMGLPSVTADLIHRAAPLHDVGKIGIPDAILLKPGRLTPDEFEVVKMHPSIGARILTGSRSEYLAVAEQIALGHHERWDGMGYPHGVAGDEIPLAARIVAVADFFDAVTHDRPYRKGWSVAKALKVIDEEMGRHFDPHAAQALLQLYSVGRPPPELDAERPPPSGTALN
ncbi:MAG: response regulator [Gemmatimonadetes bacterium]|nr:response regulator [Gemmatimonadota bacterium]